jgi:hypothetical protein
VKEFEEKRENERREKEDKERLSPLPETGTAKGKWEEKCEIQRRQYNRC